MYKSCSFSSTVSVLMFPSCVPPLNNISFKGTARGKKTFDYSTPSHYAFPVLCFYPTEKKNSSSPSNVV